MLTDSNPPFLARNRNAVIAGAVVVFHVLAIWALQAGLVMRVVELVVPVEVLAQIVDPPVPLAAPTPPTPLKPPEPVKQAVVAKPQQVTSPSKQAAAPTLLAVADAAPAPNAPSAQPIAPPAPYAPSAPVAVVAEPAPPAPPAPAKVVLPSSDADYLHNPKPRYPAFSLRNGEQGMVKLRVLVGANGLPKQVELNKSSGYDRLDQAALEAVPKWRFVPGKRGGVAEDMWFILPIPFIIE